MDCSWDQLDLEENIGLQYVAPIKRRMVSIIYDEISQVHRHLKE